MRTPSPLTRFFGLGLLLLALGWIGLHHSGILEPVERWTVEARFRLRGPLESEARVIYVNRDPAASRHFGIAWFPREYYAMAGEALLELGGAKGIFIDFVLTSDHLPRQHAAELTYAGNVALQRLLWRHPGKVVLAAAYGGKRHPFSEYASVLPDRLEGGFRREAGRIRGYDAQRNPLPDLPEFPLWCPPVDDERFPFPGLGEVGLINTSPSLNRGEQVLWVPARVEVKNAYASLYLINGMRRWQETVAARSGDGGSFTAEEDAGGAYLVLRREDGAIVSGVPQPLPQTFYAAALRLFELEHPGGRWQQGEDRLEWIMPDGTSRASIPVLGGQHLAVNWYGPWHEGNPALQRRVEEIAAASRKAGSELWDLPRIGRDPTGWIEAVEAGDEAAIDPLLLWAEPNDRANPKVSIADILFLYEAHLQAAEAGAMRARDLVARVFSQFKDTYVFIGPTDPLLQDLAPTPFDNDPVPKVAVHGNLLKMLVDGRFLQPAPAWQLPLWVLLLTAAVGWCAFSGGGREWIWKGAGALLLVGYAGSAAAVFTAFGWILPVAAPVGAAASAGVLGGGLRLWDEQRQKSRLRNLFGTYVSPDVVRLMVDSEEEPQLGGHLREVTAFFSDIESFSTIAEELSPPVLVDLMNEYLDAMTGALVGERGTLDKYIGDAVVGIFGAPLAVSDHAARACTAALRMQGSQARLRQGWREAVPPWPQGVREMRTRIGIHTGEAVVGNMGSRKRFNYTMLGDSVNLAARLEQLGKVYGTEVLVSEATREAALRSLSHLVFRSLDLVAVKGRRQPVRVYELLGQSESLTVSDRECIALYEAGLEAYLQRDWEAAAIRFARSAQLERRAGEPLHPSRVMEARCRLFQQQPPPADWDGVFCPHGS